MVVGVDLDPRAALARVGDLRDDRRVGAALAALVRSLRVEGRLVRLLVDLPHLQLAGVRRGGRPDLDRERAVVRAVVVASSDRGPRQAGRDLLDVDQRLPHPVDGRGDVK